MLRPEETPFTVDPLGHAITGLVDAIHKHSVIDPQLHAPYPQLRYATVQGLSSAGIPTIVFAGSAVPVADVAISSSYVPSVGDTVAVLVTSGDMLIVGALANPSSVSSVYNVKGYGAEGNAAILSDGATTAGSATFVSTSGPFSSADVGKSIGIANAGTPNATLATALTSGTAYTSLAVTALTTAIPVGASVVLNSAGNTQTAVASAAAAAGATAISVDSFTANYSYPVGTFVGPTTLNTTITVFVSATTVVLATSAAETISSSTFIYGTDDTTAVQAAIDAAQSAGGGTIDFPQGVYMTPGLVLRTAGSSEMSVVFRGAGRYVSTLIVGSGANFLLQMDANSSVAPQFSVYDMTLDGNYAGVGGTITQLPTTPAQALLYLPWAGTTPSAPSITGRRHVARNVRFYRPPGFTFQPAGPWDIQGCEFDSCGQPNVPANGLHFDMLGSGGNSDAVAIGNFFHDSAGNYADFVSATTGEPIRLTFIGNKSTNHLIGGIYACGQGSIIQGNDLHNNNTGSYVGYDSTTIASLKGSNVVTGNIMPNLRCEIYGSLLGTLGDICENNVSADTPLGYLSSSPADGGIGAPAIPASGSIVANPFPFKCLVVFTAASSTTVSLGPGSGAMVSYVVVPTGGIYQVPVGVGESLSLTATTMPSGWSWLAA